MSQKTIPPGAKLFRLVNSGNPEPRVEPLTDTQAAVRNNERDRKQLAGYWVHDTRAEAGEITGHPANITEEDLRRALVASKPKDLAYAAQQRHNQESGMKQGTANGAVRQEWGGVSMTGLIRYCGSKGYKAKTIRAICEEVGLKPGHSTIFIQRGKGRSEDPKVSNLPHLTKEQREQVRAIAKATKTGGKVEATEAPAETEVPAAKPKKAKKAKKPTTDAPANEPETAGVAAE